MGTASATGSIPLPGSATRGVTAVVDAVDALANADPTAWSDIARLGELRALWPAVCALIGQVARRVGIVHTSGAADADGFASTTAFLRRRLHLDAGTAARLIRVGAKLGDLNATRDACEQGRISVEHADAISHIATDLGQDAMADGGIEAILLDFAHDHTPSELRRLGRLIKVHLLDDTAAAERQVKLHEGRWLTVATTFEGMLHLEGMFDPTVAEQILAALAAYTPGPDKDLTRTATQRRADGFADIIAAALANTDRSHTGEEKPNVAVTVSYETLARRLADHHTANGADDATTTGEDNGRATGEDDVTATGADNATATGEDDGTATGEDDGTATGEDDVAATANEAPAHTGTDAARTQAANGNPASAPEAHTPDARTADARTADDRIADDHAAPAGGRHDAARHRPPGLPFTIPTPARLADAARTAATTRLDAMALLTNYLRPGGPAMLGHGHEPICADTARRLACDARIIPVVLGTHSEPLDIGRASRTVPVGMRRALDLRDAHCRFPGCDRPAKWCECHHVRFWIRDDGPTEINNLVLTCKFHHVRVHEYGWNLAFDHRTGIVTVTRPDGTPHDIISQRDGPAP